MKDIKLASKVLKIPVLEALCETYTKNLNQFLQANEIPQDSEVCGSENSSYRTNDVDLWERTRSDLFVLITRYQYK